MVEREDPPDFVFFASPGSGPANAGSLGFDSSACTTSDIASLSFSDSSVPSIPPPHPLPRVPLLSKLHCRPIASPVALSTGAGEVARINGYLHSQKASLIIDTGCSTTSISIAQVALFGIRMEPDSGGKMVNTAGGRKATLGRALVGVGPRHHEYELWVDVLDVNLDGVLVGMDWMRMADAKLEIREGLMSVQSQGRAGRPSRRDEYPFVSSRPKLSNPSISKSSRQADARFDGSPARTTERITIPARSCIDVALAFPSGAAELYLSSSTSNPHLALTPCIVRLPDDASSLFSLSNSSDRSIRVARNVVVGRLEPVSNVKVTPVLPGSSSASAPSAFSVTEEQLDSLPVGDASASQYSDLRKLVSSFADVFAKDSKERGRTGIVEHDVKTEGHVPRSRAYRMPPWKRDEVNRQLEEMLEDNVAVPSTSDYASPVVLALKKSGEWRFCVDYRALNKATIKDQYPLPRIDDILDSLAGSSIFSSLDLAAGYWQVELTPEARRKSAFITPDGLFEFTVMPFGLCNAPATFQRLMSSILRGLSSFCLVYLDDIVIFSKSWEEHLTHLEAVLERLRGAHLMAKLKKCMFATTKLEYLGHIVTPGGISPDPSKVERIGRIERPRSTSELRAFLGLVGYYRRFIKNFARIASPLTNLLKSDATSSWDRDWTQWGEVHRRAFEELRGHLTSSSILRFPDFTRPFVLQTDASGQAVGAVLSQVFEDGEHPVAYASKKLLDSEGRRIPAELECMAVVWALKHFRVYLQGVPFVLQTDHQALVYLDKNKDESSLLHRWALKIQAYDFVVQYRRGVNNGNADGLTRLRFADPVSKTAVWCDDADARVVFQPLDGELGPEMDLVFFTSFVYPGGAEV